MASTARPTLDAEPDVAAMPILVSSARILWSNDYRNSHRPLHSSGFLDRLLVIIPARSTLRFVIEGEADGAAFAQLVRADDQYMVETNCIGEGSMWVHSRASDDHVHMQCLLPAPWVPGDEVPILRHHILDRAEAGDAVWAWMTRTEVAPPLRREPCLPGPHRIPFD